MQQLIKCGILVMVVYAAGMVISTIVSAPSVFAEFNSFLPPMSYSELYGGITGDWQKYGQLFTQLQSDVFWKIYLGVVVAVPVLFLLHYVVVGAKSFSHDGPEVLFFSKFAIVIHWIGSIAFILCALTGLMMVFGSFLGGGTLIRLARYLHIIAAIVFVIPGIFMFLIWVKDMFPAPHDLLWIVILGGYLSKSKKPVPAGKYNAGQKAWFWLATLGGLTMAYSGYVIWAMSGQLDTVRLFTIIHNVLGIALVTFLLTHMYMSLFAIKGSINSMITGYKPQEEVDILHSRYRYK